MKVYVSADIEGIAGIAAWDEADPSKPDYAELRKRMTDHVAAGCEGAVMAGATEILVKDAHAAGRNIVFDRLPREAKLVRGWSQHPLFMVQELDGSFDAMVMIGYHDRAGGGGNPLAHTFSNRAVARMTINGLPVSEFHLYLYAGAMLGVPVVFVSGDEATCAMATEANASIRTVAALRGIGASTVSIHPDVIEDRIRAGVREACRADASACAIELPDRFTLELRFKEAARAYRASHYPGVSVVDDTTVRFEATEYGEVLRALMFIVY